MATNYKRMFLCENDVGAPVVAIAPMKATVRRGDLVSVNGGTLVVAQEDMLVDPESTEYAIISALTVIYEVEAVYHQTWEAEKPQEESVYPTMK